MQYRRIVKNGFNKGELIPLNDNIFEHIDTEEPNYSSIFHYNDKQFEIFKAKGSVKGLKNVQTNKLVWDFDVTGEENKRLKTMELVREETIELCSRLLELGFPEDSIQIYFSGGKGFHVEIDVNEDLSVDDFKGIIFGVAKGLELDEKIKDPNRIFRIPLTRHQETNLYKFPIIFKSLKEYNVDKIIEKVKKIDEFDLDRHIERIKLYKRVNIPEHVYEYRLKEKAQKEPESETILMDISGIDFSKKPPGFTNCKWAIANGFFPKGKRNESMMALTTLCQSLNYSKEQSYYLCKNALRKRQERTGQEFDKTDLWIEVINYVYDDDWSGVIYTCTSPEHWLYTYCEALGEHSCSNQHDDTRLKTIVQVKDKFAYFAKNIDKNTIKFGIPKLDNNVRLVTGMLVGWLGAPGAGKTSVILDILKYTSMNGEDSMFYSLDMTDELVYTRLVQNETGLDSEEIFEYHKNDKIARKVEQAGEAIHKKFSNVKICSRSGSTVEDIERDLKNYEEKTGRKVRLLVVDYLEKIKGKYSDPTATSGLVASQLNDLARTHNVCVVLLLQPQKSAGDPSEPLLTMRKIKGASVIEQDCRVIMTLWRPGFNPEDSDYDEFACIAVVKNNMGRLGRYDFHWNGVRGKIRELTPHEAKELKALEKRKADEKEQDDF